MLAAERMHKKKNPGDKNWNTRYRSQILFCSVQSLMMSVDNPEDGFMWNEEATDD